MTVRRIDGGVDLRHDDGRFCHIIVFRPSQPGGRHPWVGSGTWTRADRPPVNGARVVVGGGA